MKLDRRRRSELAEVIAHYPGTQGDRLRAYFHDRGYSGTLSDQEGQWLASLGIAPSVGTLTDRKNQLLAAEGRTLQDKVWALDRRRHPRVRLLEEAPIAPQPLRWFDAFAIAMGGALN